MIEGRYSRMIRYTNENKTEERRADVLSYLYPGCFYWVISKEITAEIFSLNICQAIAFRRFSHICSYQCGNLTLFFPAFMRGFFSSRIHDNAKPTFPALAKAKEILAAVTPRPEGNTLFERT